jgi:hypothetical protein
MEAENALTVKIDNREKEFKSKSDQAARDLRASQSECIQLKETVERLRDTTAAGQMQRKLESATREAADATVMADGLKKELGEFKCMQLIHRFNRKSSTK